MQQLSQVDILLWRSLVIFLLIGALTGITVSVLLLFRPDLMARVNAVANRWISMRHIDRWLDRSISIERWFYRHHRLMGPLLIIGAAYILAYFGLLFDRTRALLGLSAYVPNRLLLDGLLQALVLFALIGGTVALFIGLAVWLRPSLLRGVESESNQWLSSRRVTKVLEVQHDQVDRFVEHHARQVGWLLLLGSLSLFFLTLRWLV